MSYFVTFLKRYIECPHFNRQYKITKDFFYLFLTKWTKPRSAPSLSCLYNVILLKYDICSWDYIKFSTVTRTLYSSKLLLLSNLTNYTRTPT